MCLLLSSLFFLFLISDPLLLSFFGAVRCAELQYVSPKLLAARDLELAVPGSYLMSDRMLSASHTITPPPAAPTTSAASATAHHPSASAALPSARLTSHTQHQATARAVSATHIIRIAYFVPSLKVIESKQRPRKLAIRGSDGHEYPFLLKGHEDLRQDERVMQLFGLVNTLLANDRDTSKKGGCGCDCVIVCSLCVVCVLVVTFSLLLDFAYSYF